MKLGDKVSPKSGALSDTIFSIVDAPKPPKKWTVRSKDGNTTKLLTKSFLKKYYEQR